MKIILTIAAVALSTSIYAGQVKQVQKSFKQVFSIQKDHFKHWSVSAGAFTVNQNIPTDIRTVKLQYNVSMTYAFNPGLYVGMKVGFKEHGKMGNSLTAGIQSDFGVFSPYAEASVDNVSRTNLPSFEKVGYSAGVSVHLTKFATPYVELDNFLSRDQQTIAVGATVPLSDRFYSNIEYDKNIQTTASNLVLKAGYQF